MTTHAKIITVCLNPSLDRTMTIRYLSEGYTNRVTEATRLDPAGAGLSISRAIHSLGGETHAILLLGEDPTGRAYEGLMSTEAFPYKIVRRPGLTRSDIIIFDQAKEVETHLLEDCNTISPDNLDTIDEVLRELITAGDWVVLAGIHPADWPVEIYIRLLTTIHEGGANSLVATSGADLGQVAELQPAMMVVTENQAERFFNFPVRNLQDGVSCARQLSQLGVKRVMIIMEEEGTAVLRSAKVDYQLELPEVEAGTQSGVREALLAGYLLGRLRERPLTESLELGGAAASYTATQVGSQFGTREDVDPLREDVDVSRLK